MRGLLLSGERARLRVAIVEELRIWEAAPIGNEQIEQASAHVCLLEFTAKGSQSMVDFEARVAGLLRVVVVVVPVGLEDIADAAVGTEGF